MSTTAFTAGTATAALSLGNIADFDSGLREGDVYVKVRVAVGDIKWDSGSLGAAVREIELI